MDHDENCTDLEVFTANVANLFTATASWWVGNNVNLNYEQIMNIKLHSQGIFVIEALQIRLNQMFVCLLVYKGMIAIPGYKIHELYYC